MVNLNSLGHFFLSMRNAGEIKNAIHWKLRTQSKKRGVKFSQGRWDKIKKKYETIVYDLTRNCENANSVKLETKWRILQ